MSSQRFCYQVLKDSCLRIFEQAITPEILKKHLTRDRDSTYALDMAPSQDASRHKDYYIFSRKSL